MTRLATIAEVAELADALDSKSSVVTLRAGSSPAFGTIEDTGLADVSARSFLRNFCLKKCREHTIFSQRRQNKSLYMYQKSVACAIISNIFRKETTWYDF